MSQFTQQSRTMSPCQTTSLIAQPSSSSTSPSSSSSSSSSSSLSSSPYPLALCSQPSCTSPYSSPLPISLSPPLSTFPCVLCELSKDENAFIPADCISYNYETLQELREHLVNCHAKFVSRALLSPDLCDQTYYWLLSNVEYTSYGVKMEYPSYENIGRILNEVYSSVMEGDLSFFSSFGAFPSSETDVHENSNSKISSKKRKRKPLRIGDFANHLQSIETQNDTIPNGVCNSESNDDSIDIPVFTNASKAVRKSKCQICQVDICTTARQRHVYQVHLRVADLFQCSACSYTNNNSVWEMRKHCVAVHHGQAKSISNEEHHIEKIQALNLKCFPDWKLKKTANWWRYNGEALLRNQKNSNSNGDMLSLLDDNGENDDDQSVCSNEDIVRSPPEGVIVDDRTCHLCWEESRYPGRHIAQKHLKKPLYECPVCEGFGSYESCTVVKHISKVHPLDTAIPPISNLERFADEIRDLQALCFPNRPMKLVRPHIGGRPRERHKCQLCKLKVAQSDRQRHVYHRHLKKERIFECPMCSFSSNYDVHRVKWHIKWNHRENANDEPISHENEHRLEIDRLNEQCFPGWQHRRRPFWWLEIDEADKKIEESRESIEMEANEEIAKETAHVNDNQSSKTKVALQLPENSSIDEPPAKKPKISTNSSKPSEWACMLCKKEFKPSSNFLRHVAKDHLNIPLYQCPICEGHGGQDAYEVRSHMLKVHGGITVEPVSNLEQNAAEIQTVYQQCFPGRRLKNLSSEKKISQEVKLSEETKVQCRECSQEMKTEDRQIHVYRHHLKQSRLYECPLCDFSHHACSSDVKAHIKYAHRENSDVTPKSNLLKYCKEISEWNLRCFPGWINRRLPTAVLEDFNRCRICDVEVRQTSRHIAEIHLKMSLHECPLCNYGGAESRLVRRHMKNNHKKKEIKGLEPIANVVVHRAAFSEMHDKCFPGRPKRLSNITISDEGRRAKCRQCGATISRKRRLVHLLERHLKQPIYRCSLCDFNSTHDEGVVLIHIKTVHDNCAEVINDLQNYKSQVEPMSTSCFLDWHLRV